jgi:hypothetical protein
MERDFTNWSDGGRAFERMADLWPVSRRDEAPTAAEVERVKNGTENPPTLDGADDYDEQALCVCFKCLWKAAMMVYDRKTQLASIDSLQNATNPGT